MNDLLKTQIILIKKFYFIIKNHRYKDTIKTIYETFWIFYIYFELFSK